MNISDIHIIITTKVMHFLTWKTLIAAFLLGIFSCGIIIAFEMGNFSMARRVPMAGDKVKLLTVTQSTRTKIDDLMKKTDYLVAIQVVTLNFQRNIRVETLSKINDPKVQAIYDRYLSDRIYDVPIFNNNQIDNNRLLHIVNGEFICVPYKESTAYIYAPAGESFITSVCAIGIPPYNNDVSGIITVYFKRDPTIDEREVIFLFMRETAIEIFNSSVK